MTDQKVEKILEVSTYSPSEREKKATTLAQAEQVTGAIQVTDETTMALANQWLVALRSERKAIDGLRTSFTKPMLEAKRNVDASFKPLIDICTRAEKHLEKQISGYLSHQRQAQVDAYNVAATAHVQGQHQQAAEALTVASSVQTKAPQGTTVIEKWRAVVRNVRLLPEEYLYDLVGVLLERHGLPTKCMIAVHAANTPPTQNPSAIPGVVFEKSQEVRVRT